MDRLKRHSSTERCDSTKQQSLDSEIQLHPTNCFGKNGLYSEKNGLHRQDVLLSKILFLYKTLKCFFFFIFPNNTKQSTVESGNLFGEREQLCNTTVETRGVSEPS